MAADKNLSLIESELKFIRRHIQTVEGAGRSDFEAVDEIGMSVESALLALFEYRLGLEPACEEVPAGVPLAA